MIGMKSAQQLFSLGTNEGTGHMSHDSANHNDRYFARGQEFLGDVERVSNNCKGVEISVPDGSSQCRGSAAGIENECLAGVYQPDSRRGDPCLLGLVPRVFHRERMIVAVLFMRGGPAVGAHQRTLLGQLPQVRPQRYSRHVELLHQVFDG